MKIVINILSLLLGSFLNVCIYRIPRGESISYPPSHCPNCDARLRPRDLIPVLSYLFCKGKCRYCGEPISPQYPFVEILNAVIYYLLYLKFGLSILFFKYAILSSLLIVISFIDYKYKIIPDRLIVFGLIIGTISLPLYNFIPNVINGTIGLLVGGGLFLLIAIASNGAMGGGDIKLMGVLGLCLGWKCVLLVSLLSFIIGAIISILLMILKIKKRKDYIPFGPFISIAAMLTMLYSTEIINLYIKLVLAM